MNQEEVGQFVELVHEALRVRSHFEFFLWLQGRLQSYLPHEIMIAAWGDFSLGLIYFDVVSPLPGLRTESISAINLSPMLKRLFAHWQNHSRIPFTLSVKDGILKDEKFECPIASAQFKSMKTAVVHGIKDCRGRHDCLYLLLTSHETMHPSSRSRLEALLPYIDSTLRQLDPLPDQIATQEYPTPEADSINDPILGTLTAREIETMTWVVAGKTNQEIGMIMDISTFTVKNHLQRIFKKLDVLNRIQAVTNFRKIYPSQ